MGEEEEEEKQREREREREREVTRRAGESCIMKGEKLGLVKSGRHKEIRGEEVNDSPVTFL